MGMDVDYIAGKQAIDKIESLLSNKPHGERCEIADAIIKFSETLGNVGKIRTFEELISICKNNNFNITIGYQKINDYSIEIYKGYVSNYEQIYYSDGDIDLDFTILKAINFVENIEI